jgi:hypothetical protein
MVASVRSPQPAQRVDHLDAVRSSSSIGESVASKILCAQRYQLMTERVRPYMPK